MTDGPYAETKEQLGGFWVVEAPDRSRPSHRPSERTDLTAEAIRLARQLRDMVAADPSIGPLPEVDGLLALMLLVDSRAPARVRDDALVALDEQDRTLWDAALIDEGHRLVRGCLALNRPGPYQLQAAIAARGAHRRGRCRRGRRVGGGPVPRRAAGDDEAEQRFLRTRRDRPLP